MPGKFDHSFIQRYLDDTMSSKYQRLFEPINIGELGVPNRIVMAPMGTHFANPDSSVNEKLVDYYEARARGGVGLIIQEITHVDGKESKSEQVCIGVHHDKMIPGLSRIVEAVKANDTRIFLQLHHAGRQNTRAWMDHQPVSASAIPCDSFYGLYREVPRELTTEEIVELIENYGKAARRAQLAGYDGVEVHGSHGYLIAQFLSAHTNRRTDLYGGDLKGRLRFALEIFESIRAQTDGRFPIGFRIAGDQYVEAGYRIDTAVEIAKIVEPMVDYIHISAGSNETLLSLAKYIQPVYFKQGYNVHLAAAVKQAVRIPVISVGSLQDPELGESILREGKADMICIGRGLLAEPDLPRMAKHGERHDYRLCIRCNECLTQLFVGNEVRCAINPCTGKEAKYRLTPVLKPKKVVVVGGGPAGMEAALAAAGRGHEVTLYEKRTELGGNMLPAGSPNFKTEIRHLVAYYKKKVEYSGIHVILNTEATAEQLKQSGADALVIAVGGTEIKPEPRGIVIENSEPVSAIEALVRPSSIKGKKVAVLGGGCIGSEAALFLSSEHGKQVILLEVLPELMQDELRVNREAFLDVIRNERIDVRTETRVLRVEAGKVTCEDKRGKEEIIEVDAVVLALGLEPNRELFDAVKGYFEETYFIGDCKEPRKIYQAVHAGGYVGRII